MSTHFEIIFILCFICISFCDIICVRVILMNNLKKLRAERGLTQRSLAVALSVAQNTVSQWELGSRSLDSDSLSRLSAFFGVSADCILGLPETPVGLSDFEFALHEETRRLTDEDRDELLRMARRMRELMELKEQNEK